jgi:hypothetical protein
MTWSIILFKITFTGVVGLTIYFACIAHDTPVEVERRRERTGLIQRLSRDDEADDMAGDESGTASDFFCAARH